MDRYAKTIGPPVWDRLAEGLTARAGVEGLLLAAVEVLPESAVKPGGCLTWSAGEYSGLTNMIVGDVAMRPSDD